MVMVLNVTFNIISVISFYWWRKPAVIFEWKDFPYICAITENSFQTKQKLDHRTSFM